MPGRIAATVPLEQPTAVLPGAMFDPGEALRRQALQTLALQLQVERRRHTAVRDADVLVAAVLAMGGVVAAGRSWRRRTR